MHAKTPEHFKQIIQYIAEEVYEFSEVVHKPPKQCLKDKRVPTIYQGQTIANVFDTNLIKFK